MSIWNIELAEHSAQHCKKARCNVELAEYSVRYWKKVNIEARWTFSATLKSWNVDPAQHSANVVLNIEPAEYLAGHSKLANVELECSPSRICSATLKKKQKWSCNVELSEHSAGHWKKWMSSWNIEPAEYSARHSKKMNVKLECSASRICSATLKKSQK